MKERKLIYKISKDYKHLRELLDAGHEIVCFTTYDFFKYDRYDNHQPYMVTDVCTARKLDTGEYSFGVRGHGYGDYDPGYHKFSFEDFCKNALKLEYIEPNI